MSNNMEPELDQSEDGSSHEEIIGERMKHYRLEQNINQTDLAKQAGVARRTITSVETGKGCTLNTLLRLLRALNRMDILQDLLDEPPLSPQQIHYANTIRKPIRKYASRPRSKPPEKPFVWGDEQAPE
ncbi:helix-turn-helix domain-containing protein [Akkermansiaceae bacterium]|nr:helix-turn-helix domain-containing protein [Akkermansiaceae bacterium]